MHRRLALASATALAALAPAVWLPERSSAYTVLASGLPLAPKVSADGETLAWSSYDRSVSAWRLMVFHDGITQALPIAPSSTPFDVDLGDNGDGGLVATYSRCSRPSTPALPHGCRIFVYDFATASERPIAVANIAGASQFLPSMAAGRVAFVRIHDGQPAGSANPPQIYVQSVAGGEPRLLPGGIENSDSATGPTALDLNAQSLAFTWDAHGIAGPFYPNGTSELWVDGLSGGQTLIDRQVEQEIELTQELSPTLVGSGVAYGIAAVGDETYSEFRSFGLPSAIRGAAVAPEGLESTATGSAGTIYSRCVPAAVVPPPGGGSCEVDLTSTVPYVNPDEQLAYTSRPTTISVYRGNWLAFSAYEPASGNYRLMLRDPNGSVLPAPVAPRRVPFDVQVGPLYGGKQSSLRTALVAVYSRCRVEPQLDPVDMLPLPFTGRGCRLYRYDLGSSHEQPIPGSGSRYLPSAWDGELAFVRQGPGGAPELYLGSLSGHGLRRLAGGPAGSDSGPSALVLHEDRVAFVWEYRHGGSVRSELRLDGPGARTRLLDSTASTNGSNQELSPSFTPAGVLAWARHERGGRSWMFTYGLSGQGVDTYLAPNPVEGLGTTQLSGQPQLHGTIIYARGEADGAAAIMRMANPPAAVIQR